jgi:hypothetical protein
MRVVYIEMIRDFSPSFGRCRWYLIFKSALCHLNVTQSASNHIVIISQPTFSILAEASSPIFQGFSIVATLSMKASNLMLISPSTITKMRRATRNMRRATRSMRGEVLEVMLGNSGARFRRPCRTDEELQYKQ